MPSSLGTFGYNRDGKKGKKQIIIRLLCDEEGVPLSIEVFPGNTQDHKTVRSQIRKLAERFGGDEVTLVGDRGMLKTRQIEEVERVSLRVMRCVLYPSTEKMFHTSGLDRDCP